MPGIDTPWVTVGSATGLRWANLANFPSNVGSIGNGSWTIRYKRALGITFFRFSFIWGTTTVAPTGLSPYWAFELPADVRPLADDVMSSVAGLARCLPAGSALPPNLGAAFCLKDADGSGTGALLASYLDSDGLEQGVGNTTPFSWDPGDRLTMTCWIDSLDN